MANGLIGKAFLAANTWTPLGAALANSMTVNVRFANEAATAQKVWTAITNGGAPAAGDTITPALSVAPNCPYEDTGIAVSAGERVYVKSDGANTTARAHGIDN